MPTGAPGRNRASTNTSSKTSDGLRSWYFSPSCVFVRWCRGLNLFNVPATLPTPLRFLEGSRLSIVSSQPSIVDLSQLAAVRSPSVAGSFFYGGFSAVLRGDGAR